ncbi:hypothetical protein L1887_09242 [Cichorium endivia]|nr:hypothetical protein L1887_09242 [Cichorium endivia]
MNEASSSSSFPQQLAGIVEENKVTFYSNDFHLEQETYNYYQQPDHTASGGPLQIPLMIDYQSTRVDNNHGSIQQPLKKLPDWRCLQVTENPRKRMNDGRDQNTVNTKLTHHERMQGIGRVRERVPMRRSQKLADKITSLQKLVSPYGKTDTASVLQEAHISINLLHHQIQKLLQETETSLNNVGAIQFRSKEAENGLHDRGLCLVPISNPHINDLCFGKQNFMPGNY